MPLPPSDAQPQPCRQTRNVCCRRHRPSAAGPRCSSGRCGPRCRRRSSTDRRRRARSLRRRQWQERCGCGAGPVPPRSSATPRPGRRIGKPYADAVLDAGQDPDVRGRPPAERVPEVPLAPADGEGSGSCSAQSSNQDPVNCPNRPRSTRSVGPAARNAAARDSRAAVAMPTPSADAPLRQPPFVTKVGVRGLQERQVPTTGRSSSRRPGHCLSLG